MLRILYVEKDLNFHVFTIFFYFRKWLRKINLNKYKKYQKRNEYV